jgi:predicted acylesterase/phospholipase RssA
MGPYRQSRLIAGFVVLGLALAGGLRSAQSGVVDSDQVAIEKREGDIRRAVLKDGVGVCVSLSGGGLRAAAFHAGVLKGIQEGLRSIDPRGDGIDVVSGISGGSITAALYSLYPDQAWSSTGIARLKDFIGSGPVKAATTGFLVSLGFQNRIMAFQRLLDSGLYGGSTFEQLPNKPYLIIGTTDLRTGDLVLFTKVTVWHYRKVPVSQAVAASSAIPAIFNAVELKYVRITADVAGEDDQLSEDGPVLLNDGGIRDNLGLTPLLTKAVERTVRSRDQKIQPLCHVIFQSDASLRVRKVERDAVSGNLWPFLRSIDVLMELVSGGTEAIAKVKQVAVIPIRMPDGFRAVGTASDLRDDERDGLIASGYALARDTLDTNSGLVRTTMIKARAAHTKRK